MELEASHKKILEYLQKYGQVNTFKLSRHLGINRNELIGLIKDLTGKRLAFVKHGSVSINEIKYQKFIENKELKKEIEELQAKKADITQQLAEEIRLLNSIHGEKAEIEDVAAKAAKKERFLNQKEEEMKKREESVFAAEKKLEEDKEALRKEQESINAKADYAVSIEKGELSKEKEKLAEDKKNLKKEGGAIDAERRELDTQKSEIEALRPKIKPKENKVSKSETNKAKLKKGKKKAKEVRAKRLGKEKQEKLESWLRQAKLEIERLKVEIELASMSRNASKIRSLEASAAKLRNMIDWRMREK